ncbi:DUF4124 domain-containing protein [Duganella violaceipulchra]|uniref:DUF4124 domain-containing protein n=1 Tax=Duganella violaceipulchra TaxID=2849652 RepID=A0AA41H8J8_9BURK|nr:DUF4124 domain-containing protein [Duganella violaceicalia]MBV6319551.1 DUF4124 domain-containing protein [Duganella violaceicalia]MCP2006637.1 type IV secretory pathway VirB10-like protein [Duganella violaceicalia]
MTDRTLHCLAGALLLAVSSLAMAQYIWIDDKGVKQLSDRPPPPSVPEQRILKAPGKTPFNPNAEAEAPAAEAAPESAVKRPPTLAERNADFNKRKADAAAADKKAADEARQKADIAANCDAARKNQQALADGVRMSNYDSNGERGIMGDAERAEMAKKNQKVLAGCK